MMILFAFAVSVYFLILSSSLVSCSAIKCPPAKSIVPCTCLAYVNHISCWNIQQGVNLKHVFTNLTKSLGGRSKKIVFEEFKLIESEVEELGSDDDDDKDGIFDGVAFNVINIEKNPRLKRIHRNAFKSSFNTTSTIRISENPLLGNDPPYEREIFDVLNSFVLAKEIWLSENNISVIPDRAFSRPQESLTFLSFVDNKINHVGNYAFKGLDSLKYLLLDSNRIDKISNKAFDLAPGYENSSFRLFLRDNFLNDDSFELGSFSKINKKLSLDLSKNNLTHLSRKVFGPIFKHPESAVYLRHNPLICDCNFKWLFDNKLLYNSSNPTQYYVHSIQCNGTKNNNNIIEFSESHFEHCPKQQENHCGDDDIQLCQFNSSPFQSFNYLHVSFHIIVMYFSLALIY